MLRDKIEPFWTNGFRDKTKSKTSPQISLILDIIPLKEGVADHYNKFQFPLLKDVLCQVCLKLSQWFLSRNPKGEN